MCEYNETDRITPKVKIKNKMQRMQFVLFCYGSN